jgi:hypothetical protein
MPTYTNIATGQVLTQDEFSALVCNETYTCCNQADGVWFTANDAKNEYQWQQYFIANNLCSDSNAPINTIPPSISGTLVVGNVLTCSTGTWTSDTGIIPPYTYQWYRGATLLVGETNNTYTLVQADAGQNIKCVVTACDSDGCTNADSNVVYIIDAEADAHYNRVIADGGTIPLGLTALNEFVVSVKNNYSVASVNSAMWALKPHWGISGIKTASGTGATAGGRATSVLYDICGVNGDFIQTTASAQPLGLVHSGSNYAWLSGVAGNYFSTPNAVANQITGDIEIVAKVNFASFSVTDTIVSKAQGAGAGADFAYLFSKTNSNLTFSYSNTGLVSSRVISTSSATLSSAGYAINQDFFIKVSRSATSGDVVFSTSPDGIVYTQLGSTQTTTPQPIANITSMPTVGSWANATAYFNGIIYRVTISNSIGGSPVVDFNPNSYNRATSQTSWVSATGETWTLNTASTNNALKACIVDQTMIMGNGTSYGMRAPSLNINDTAITSYTVFRKFVNTGLGQIINELSANANSNNGKWLVINDVSNQEGANIRANVGSNSSLFTSNSLLLKVATSVCNIANANESAPYYINNASQTLASNSPTSNNTTAMNATGYNFLARNNASSAWANVIAIGDIVVKGEDDTTKRTAMFNLLKTLSKF